MKDNIQDKINSNTSSPQNDAMVNIRRYYARYVL